MKTIYQVINGTQYELSKEETKEEIYERISRERANGRLVATIFALFMILTFILLMSKICPCKW
jgi:hypothetical protein